MAKESAAVTFDLPEELLVVLPSDPYEQLDVARKITSMALSTRVSSLESESCDLRAKLAEKDHLIAGVQSQVESLDASLADALDKLSRSELEKEKLVKENESLTSTVKKLSRDASKLEIFKKTLMQSLQEDEDSSGPARAGASHIIAKPTPSEDVATLPPSRSSSIRSQFSERRILSVQAAALLQTRLVLGSHRHLPYLVTSSASQSTGFPFSAPATSSSHVFGSSGSTSASSSTPIFGATSVTATSNGAPIFGTSGNLSASTGAPIFGSTNASSVSPLFGSASASPIFGSTGASSASTFSFTSAASSTSSVPVFGNSNPAFAFGLVPSGNDDQVNAEDSVAEDTVLTTTPSVPVFGQQPISPQPSTGFMFNPSASTVANPFQFGSQQNLATPPNPSPFQASGSLDLGGGSFLLGTGGDKSGRKIIKVKHKQRRK